MYRAENNIEDVRYILDHLREEDLKEVITSRGEKWKEEILNELENENIPYSLGRTKEGDIPVLICGAYATDKNNPSLGVVWMLSTPEIEKHQIAFLKKMKKEIEIYDEKFGILYNQIYEANQLAKNWLKWAGFRFPKEEKKKTFLDKIFLKTNVPEEFEIFYRERPVKGLGKQDV